MVECCDPYWASCQEEAVFCKTSNRSWDPDEPDYCCQECLEALVNAGQEEREDWSCLPRHKDRYQIILNELCE